MPNEKLKIPDDLKAMYTMQKQVAHSFRDDDDVVKVAHRTQMLIERIARLEADNARISNDFVELECHYEKLALENSALKAQLRYWLPTDQPLLGAQDSICTKHREKWYEARSILAEYDAEKEATDATT